MSDDTTAEKRPPSRVLASMDTLIFRDENSFTEVEGMSVPYQRWHEVTKRIAELSGGEIALHWIRRTPGSESTGTPWHSHEFKHIVSIVLKGWARFDLDGVGEMLIEAGTVAYQLSNNLHREIESSEDFEALEFTVAANGTHTVYLMDENGEYGSHTMEDQ